MKQRIIVTGASRGIGRAIALRLATNGITVAINYARSEAAAQSLVDTINQQGHDAYPLPFDISNRAETLAALSADLDRHGAPWGVICNAGIAMDAPFPAMTDDMWDRVVGTNLDGFYNVLRPLIMPMVSARNGGRIVAMSSVSGVTGNRGQVNYAATKAGIIGAAKSLAQELAKRRITVNVVAPGIIDTDMVTGIDKNEVLKAIPMRRYGTAEEVAGVVAFLLSPDAGYMTGQVLNINGGMI